MRRVLITSVTGFAGSHLVDHLLTRGDCEIQGISPVATSKSPTFGRVKLPHPVGDGTMGS